MIVGKVWMGWMLISVSETGEQGDRDGPTRVDPRVRGLPELRAEDILWTEVVVKDLFRCIPQSRSFHLEQ